MWSRVTSKYIYSCNAMIYSVLEKHENIFSAQILLFRIKGKKCKSQQHPISTVITFVIVPYTKKSEPKPYYYLK